MQPLDVIDKTLSPMGGRLLKRWLALPLKDSNKIRSRHEVVSYLQENQEVLQNAKPNKANFRFRAAHFKIASGKVSPREVVYLKESLDAITL
jgi:DNA mismatch repair protein MutS